MIDRRGFLAAMLGVAVAPKTVLQGIATPEPVKTAMASWVTIWSKVNEVDAGDGSVWACTVTIMAPEGSHLSEWMKRSDERPAGMDGWEVPQPKLIRQLPT